MRTLGLVLALSLLAAPVAAQEQTEAQRRATARALFAEGVGFAQQEQWAEAADRFRRTLDLHPTPVVAYNLATALVELGRLVEAAEHLRLTQRFPGAEDQVRREAEAMLAEIEPRIAQLRITVGALPSGAYVEHDGRVLTRAELGVDVPSDPGTHHLRLVRAGDTLDEATIELAPGAREVVTLGVDVSPGAVAESAVTPSDAPIDSSPPPSGGSVVDEWWFWTLIAVVVVGAGVGITAGVVVSGQGGGEPVAGDLDPPILRGMVLP